MNRAWETRNERSDWYCGEPLLHVLLFFADLGSFVIFFFFPCATDHETKSLKFKCTNLAQKTNKELTILRDGMLIGAS